MKVLEPHAADKRTARVTGVLYLGLALTGMVGFLLVRPMIFEPGDPGATVQQLVDHEALARTGIVLEMAIAATQALAALWFFRLFRAVDAFAAGAIAVFGIVNAVVILISAACMATALDVALDPVGAPEAAQLAYLVSENLWVVGTLFFGLWLVPMGWCVIESRWMPRALGWILVAGGVGYVISGFVDYLAPDADMLVEILTVPASVGEFWMIGYLLVRGVRRSSSASPLPAETLSPAPTRA
ncbi:DUF4386 domain-containing protein [Nocardioides glacieisoli]|uniref:DUF4386 domain-containing protein n=2 Tax=Nocardioides glacieisoli TaxID=1168730 RepID=A0A4Q2S8J2_9ACTN|nr:DUF4386 domain-containing protein [Nocardioides glacieisoli]